MAGAVDTIGAHAPRAATAMHAAAKCIIGFRTTRSLILLWVPHDAEAAFVGSDLSEVLQKWHPLGRDFSWGWRCKFL
ncbi:hypothetical protein ABTF80_20870, partial [Acinetobacter baumannii]